MKKKEEKRDFIEMLKNVIIMLMMLWLIFSFFIGIKMAPNDDMRPKIGAGDVLIYYRLDKIPTINEAVVINKNKTDYVGRVVGCPGDTIEITDKDALMVNGNMVVEKDIFSPTPRYEGFVEYPLTLASDEYFILADKRNGGEDSRYFGAVKKKEIRGVIIGQFKKADI